jgi:hypothetical protein
MYATGGLPLTTETHLLTNNMYFFILASGAIYTSVARWRFVKQSVRTNHSSVSIHVYGEAYLLQDFYGPLTGRVREKLSPPITIYMCWSGWLDDAWRISKPLSNLSDPDGTPVLHQEPSALDQELEGSSAWNKYLLSNRSLACIWASHRIFLLAQFWELAHADFPIQTHRLVFTSWS